MIINDAVNDIFPSEREIVVTYRCDREKKPHILVNGKINTGVMGFGSNIESSFFNEWKKLCEDGEHTDQSALSTLLERQVELGKINSRQMYDSYSVRVLDGNIYNDVTCRIGKIFHFKSAGRRRNKHFGFMIFAFLQRLFPETISWCVEVNRKYRLFIWHK